MKNSVSTKRLLTISLMLILSILIFSGIIILALLRAGYKTASIPISYLPDLDSVDFPSEIRLRTPIELDNSYYKLKVSENGRFYIEDKEGCSIMYDMIFYALHDSTEDIIGLKNVVVKLTNQNTVLIEGEGATEVDVRILLTVNADKPVLDVQVNTIYTKRTIVWRESLIGSFIEPLTQVFRKNGQVDYNNFEEEYWLNKKGALFGTGDRSALINNIPNISSLQINTQKKQLWINLDYHLDHPYIYIPPRNNVDPKWFDRSPSVYEKGEGRENSFSIYFGIENMSIPRVMSVPFGYLAGYVFTEHADETSLKTHRAVYFGSEKITQIDSATGGFAGHKIPVTKSVFYFDTIGPSVHEDSSFLNFLDQLYSTGLYEICLHTPDNSNSNRIRIEESLEFMRNRFGSKTWIDHGMYNGKENREAFVCDGLNPGSDYYAADLWEKFGIKYFWNTAVEMSYLVPEAGPNKLDLYKRSVKMWRSFISPRELKNRGFFNSLIELFKRHQESIRELDSYQSVKGDSYPTPLYFKHPTITREFYSWVTDYPKCYNNLSSETVKIEDILLHNLVSDWGIFIDHGYYARIRGNDDVLSYNEGKIIIDPNFDRILELMATRREEGDLYIATISELLDYWILLENVDFNYLPNGLVEIINNNKEPIKGLSIAVRASEVLLDGKVPQFKQVGKDLILWFDIPAGGHALLQTEP